MKINELRKKIREFLHFRLPENGASINIHDSEEQHGYTKELVSYKGDEGDEIPAFLLLPENAGTHPAVLIHHQHNSKRHYGKSEVCGLIGDPLQAFGPALARRGVAVLAPDSICFEERRRNQRGTAPHELDVAQHYDEMCYRLLRGDTLMRKVLDDSARGISALREHPLIDPARIGIAGHSYGGHTTIFHAALDPRINFACASGAACSFQYRMEHHIGIEMAEAIPSFAVHFDIADLVKCMAPKRVLIVSASDDKASMDATRICEEARRTFTAFGQAKRLTHKRFDGHHPLTPKRFEYIIDWLTSSAMRT